MKIYELLAQMVEKDTNHPADLKDPLYMIRRDTQGWLACAVCALVVELKKRNELDVKNKPTGNSSVASGNRQR